MTQPHLTLPGSSCQEMTHSMSALPSSETQMAQRVAGAEVEPFVDISFLTVYGMLLGRMGPNTVLGGNAVCITYCMTRTGKTLTLGWLVTGTFWLWHCDAFEMYLSVMTSIWEFSPKASMFRIGPHL